MLCVARASVPASISSTSEANDRVRACVHLGVAAPLLRLCVLLFAAYSQRKQSGNRETADTRARTHSGADAAADADAADADATTRPTKSQGRDETTIACFNTQGKFDLYTLTFS